MQNSKNVINNKVLIISGEHSGDNLGVKLINSLKHKKPNLEIAIMGGEKMQNTGSRLLVDSRKLDIVGIWETIIQWQQLRQAFKKIRFYLKNEQPKLVILIDYPGFNLRIAKYAKQAGCKVLFYVSPQIWAWRYGRVKKIRDRVDHIAVLFPFEEEIYQKENIPVSFVGHPMLDWVKTETSKEQIYQQMELDRQQPIICLLPGSRITEINRHLPLLNQCITIIKKQIPTAQFILPVAINIDKTLVKQKLNHKVHLTQGNTYECLAISDVAMCASGTASLEVALFEVPMIIFYKLSWITYCLIRLFVHTKWVGLCNIIAQKTIVQEFIQHRAQAKPICSEVIKILKDNNYRKKTQDELRQIKQKISCPDPIDKVANLALDFIAIN